MGAKWVIYRILTIYDAHLINALLRSIEGPFPPLYAILAPHCRSKFLCFWHIHWYSTKIYKFPCAISYHKSFARFAHHQANVALEYILFSAYTTGNKDTWLSSFQLNGKLSLCNQFKLSTCQKSSLGKIPILYFSIKFFYPFH